MGGDHHSLDVWQFVVGLDKVRLCGISWVPSVWFGSILSVPVSTLRRRLRRSNQLGPLDAICSSSRHVNIC
jgi:hypothetical protein